jgi:pimeloyl-ACP methyl ester carboxylesterase
MSTKYLLAGAVMMLTAAVSSWASAAQPAETVVLVHGAWADGSSWAKVIPLLEKAGLNVVAVQNPLSGMANDVAITQRVIDAQPGKVILVGHSLGGAVITEAGVDTKVAALVYVAAFAPPLGASVNDLSKGQPSPPWVKTLVADSAGYLTLPESSVARYFAQDLSPTEIKVLAATQGPTFAGMLDDKMTAAAFASKPSWYVVAKHDGMIPPPAEEAMAKAMHARITELDSSHVAMLSKPKEVAAVIIEAAKTMR